MCQVHTAVKALVRYWWLGGRVSEVRINHTVNVIRHWQERIANARKSHIKETRRKLRKLGILLKNVIRCNWPDPAQ